MRVRVSPNPASSGCAGWWISEFPRISHPPAAPSLRLQVAPNPAATAGSMMIPRLDSNFASSARPRMNLRVQSGLAHPRLTLDAFSISFRPSTLRTSRLGIAEFNRLLHLPARLELRSDSLQGHQLFWRVGLSNLWKQVQKTEKSVDFTSLGALIDEGSAQLSQFQCKWAGILAGERPAETDSA